MLIKKLAVLLSGLIVSVHICAMQYDYKTDFLLRYPEHKDFEFHFKRLSERDQQSALFNAAKLGNVKAVEVLLSLGLNINTQKDDSRETPLHKAAAYGSVEIVEFLLQQGANPHAQDKKGRSALGFALAENNEPVVRLLMEYGARGNSPNSFPSIYQMTSVDLGVIKATKTAPYKPPYQQGEFARQPRIIFAARENYDFDESVWSMNLAGGDLRQELSSDTLFNQIIQHDADGKAINLTNMLSPHPFLGIEVNRYGYLYSFTDKRIVLQFVSNTQNPKNTITKGSFHYSSDEEVYGSCDKNLSTLNFSNFESRTIPNPCKYQYVPGMEKAVRFYRDSIEYLNENDSKSRTSLPFTNRDVLHIPHEGRKVLFRSDEGLTLYDLKDKTKQSFDLSSHDAALVPPYIFANDYSRKKEAYCITRINIDTGERQQYFFDGIREIGAINYYQP